MEHKIPVTNKDKIVYAYVDEDDYDKCMEITWHISFGYAINTKYGFIHRFILKAKKGDPRINHIDGNRLNNKKSNIEFSTPSQNSQNRPKAKNTLSQYIGVSISHGKWRTAMNCNSIYYSKTFDLETHAAYYYDILAIRHHGQNAKINNILKPEGFVEPIKKIKTLPKGIMVVKNKYRVHIVYNKNHFSLGTFKTLEDAMEVYNKKHKEIEDEEKIKRLNTEIQRNSSGQAIIYVSYKDITKECIVDEGIYHDLIKITWCLNPFGYARGYYKGKRFLMHRYIMREELSIIE